MSETLNDLTDCQMNFIDEFMRTGDKKKALVTTWYDVNCKHSTMTAPASIRGCMRTSS